MSYLTALFIVTSAQLKLPPNLLNSICYVESRHDISAIHLNDGIGHSVGICQIKLTSAQLVGFKGTEQQLMDPKINIWFAGKLLKHQLKRYNSIEKAVIAYNMGHASQLTTSKYQARVFREWRQHDSSNRRNYSGF